MFNLYLDDIRNPPNDRENGYVIVRKYNPCIHLINNNPNSIEFMSLDHDLGDFSGQDGREMTGYDVLLWMEKNLDKITLPPKGIMVHSANPIGKRRMIEVVRSLYQKEN